MITRGDDERELPSGMSTEQELAALSVEPPPGLFDRVVARWVRMPGPIGELYVASTEKGIAYLRTGVDPAEFTASFRARFARPLLVGEQPPAGLVRALESDLRGADELPVDLRGLTEFARDVLTVTREIPVGETRPYAWIASEIGRPKAVRAVGTALGRNPVPLVIPCHRVIRSDGTSSGYIFGPSARERLLRAEAG
jgi:methylated-DNA-[protein]-cysteine S-methyltransferase